MTQLIEKPLSQRNPYECAVVLKWKDKYARPGVCSTCGDYDMLYPADRQKTRWLCYTCDTNEEVSR